MKALDGRLVRLESAAATRMRAEASALPLTGGLTQDEALVAWVSWRLRQGRLTGAERDAFEAELEQARRRLAEGIRP